MTRVSGATRTVIPPSTLARSIEHIPVTVYGASSQASSAVAAEIAELIRQKALHGQQAVLGLATGSTPTSVYAELVRLHRDEGLSFRNVVTFNLDEYWPMEPVERQSYHRFMNENLFDHVDLPKEQRHIPSGTVPREEVLEHCEVYEQAIRKAGGLDLQILGIGRSGHIGFNEPGSPRDSRTRMITLDRVTRMDAAEDFFGEWHVPRKAITMGVETILSAKRVVLVAFGEGKAAIIKEAVEGEISPAVSAGYLQDHPNARVVLDLAAAADLTRFSKPWLVGPLSEFGHEWDQAMTSRATIWLAGAVEKSVLKLTDEDYNENGLQELLSARGSAYDINIKVFKSLANTITGWPGGKAGRRTRKGESETFPKRVLVLSPHPDDDVICMGGTLIRLCDQGHDVHVAYQSSGNLAVWDEDAIRFADFVVEYCRSFGFGVDQVERIEQQVGTFVRNKAPGDIDKPEIQTIKGLIRRTEARAAARYSGVKEDHIHFLDLPFYETGTARKNPISDEDVKITVDLLRKIEPHQIYAAGDMSDPHGTHRLCMETMLRAFKLLEGEAWLDLCEVWLYRGAWQEWEVHEIDMAVPLAPSEVARKRLGIFKHQSQKDRAVYPGPHDPREFWQRAEDRNRATARRYDKLGLAEYEAIESFVKWNPQMSLQV